eukprot:m.299530 g.299530  ORF g.299530 m.299530 type:complete len:283 (+) comp20115_c0_seq7:192-1040(+)
MSSSGEYQRPAFSCGRQLHVVPDLPKALAEVHDHGMHFIVMPLVHPRYERSEKVIEKKGMFTRSDMVLSSREWSRYVVGQISDWIMADMTVPSRREAAAKAFHQEASWAQHLSLPALQISLLSKDCAFMAGCLNTFLQMGGSSVYWVHVPISNTQPVGAVTAEGDETNAVVGNDDPWHWWATLRALCTPVSRLCVALEITADLPSGEALLRWMGEPVKAVIVPTSIFLRNAKGFPVLSKAHQLVVKRLLKYDPQFIIKGNTTGEEGDTPYLRYLKHLCGVLL